MNYQDNDTLNKGQQNKNQSQADKSKNKEAMVAKLLASSAVGLMAGAGATYAAEHLMATQNTETEEAPVQEPAAEQASAEPTKPTVEERVEALEEKDRIREQQEHARHQQEAERQQHEAQRQKHEEESRNQEHKPEKKEEEHHEENHEENHHEDNHDEDPLRGHEVKIESVEEQTLDDGTTVNVYSGTVDGHQAAFMANSNGQVVAAIVDVNDNGNVDDNEVIDLRESNMTTQYMASHQVAPANPEIQVVAVHNNVEMGGETVDVAVVSMDNQPVMFVDANQNGEVDLAIADVNQNGNIDEGEVQDVSDAHITMPTEDDITGNVTARIDDGDTEDYSNNADVTVYDV